MDPAQLAASNRQAAAAQVDLTPALSTLASAVQAEQDPQLQQMLAEAGQLIQQVDQARQAGQPQPAGPPAGQPQPAAAGY